MNLTELSFDQFDIMCEVKMKNLARDRLYFYALERGGHATAQ